MKYAFYLLLVGNVAFYLWETGSGREPRERGESHMAAAAERIVLLKELAEIPGKTPQPSADAEQIPTQQPASPAAPAADEPAAELVQPETAIQSATSPPSTAAEPAPSTDAANCFLLGPYRNAAASQMALDRVKSTVDVVEPVTQSAEMADSYWVLLPAADTLEAAKANRKMLMEKGIRDMWLFDKGELKGAISLGLFHDRERAEALRRQLLGRQIEAQVTPRLVKVEAHWLRLQWSGDKAGLEAVIGKLETAKAADAQAAELKPCD